mmetsp:Transcript_8146/g.27146  ORF Transcript_8146/g.27146 Transcript_8146/m.27146 type:complete len:222 (+) Transcript_8146:927-1592(+)
MRSAHRQLLHILRFHRRSGRRRGCARLGVLFSLFRALLLHQRRVGVNNFLHALLVLLLLLALLLFPKSIASDDARRRVHGISRRRRPPTIVATNFHHLRELSHDARIAHHRRRRLLCLCRLRRRLAIQRSPELIARAFAVHVQIVRVDDPSQSFFKRTLALFNVRHDDAHDVFKRVVVVDEPRTRGKRSTNARAHGVRRRRPHASRDARHLGFEFAFERRG